VGKIFLFMMCFTINLSGH